MDVVTKRIEVRGLTSAWLEAGPDEATDATPIVVLLHGFPDTAASWNYQIDALKVDATVVAPFLRGGGPSEKAPGLGRYSPDSIGLDTLEILNVVDPTGKRPVLAVGHDLGVMHAWRLAELLQKRLIGLVAINGLTINQMVRRAKSPRQLLRSWYMFLMQVPLLPEALAKAVPLPLLKFAHGLGGLAPEFRPDAAELRGAMVGPLNQYRAFLRDIPKNLRRAGKRLSCPVLVLWGADDTFLMAPTTDEIERDASRVTIRILKGNHWLHREQAARVNLLIQEFLVAQRVPA